MKNIVQLRNRIAAEPENIRSGTNRIRQTWKLSEI